MLFTNNSISNILEIHKEVENKILEFWSKYFSKEYVEYVPWMSLLPSVDSNVNEQELTFDFGSKKILTSYDKLKRVEHLIVKDYPQVVNELEKSFSEESDLQCKFRLLSNIESDYPALIENFIEAESLLKSSSPFLSSLYEKIVVVVLPLDTDSYVGMSSDLARGAIFISCKTFENKLDLAIDLVHELGHQVLMTLNATDPFIINGIDSLVYSGIRKMKRPAIQCFHAAMALAFMLHFINSVYRDTESTACNSFDLLELEDKKAETKRQLITTINALESSKCEFSQLGLILLSDFKKVIES